MPSVTVGIDNRGLPTPPITDSEELRKMIGISKKRAALIREALFPKRKSSLPRKSSARRS